MFRRHWLLFLAPQRGSNIGSAYDVVDNDKSAKWERRNRDNHDISESGTFQDKLVLGRIEDEKGEDFENVIDETPLPVEGEDCQTYVMNVVKKLVEKNIVHKLALTYMTQAPSN